MSEPQIKPGYKQTDVGVIPEDWETAYLSSVSKEPMQNGLFFAPSRKGTGVKLINVGDLYSSTPIDRNSLELFNATENERNRFKVQDGDIFFTRSSVVPSGIAHCNIYLSTEQEQVVFDSHVIRVRPARDRVEPAYLLRLCVASAARHYLISHAKTAIMTTIDQGVLGKCPIPLPPLPEQQAIATALGDADALIEALDQLIAKKRNLKQAAMQQLLTGKKRLPGFTGKWENYAFETLASPRRERIDPRGGVTTALCVELDHIQPGTGRLIPTADDPGRGSLKSTFQTRDILFGKLRAYLRKYWLADQPGICSTELWVLAAKPLRSTPEFIRQVVATESFIGAASTAYGTHMPRSDWKVVGNLEIHSPPLPEQTAIAAVLSEMDAEIAALEARRDKTRDLKQGMMQELLTGRIRLICPAMQTNPAPQPLAKIGPALVPPKTAGHTWEFNEAVVIAVLAANFGSEQFPLGRKRYTKLSYLLHRHAEGKAQGYLKKAAGPYNPRTRYAGPEKIAQQRKYIRRHSRAQFTGFIAAEKISEAQAYFEKWYGTEAIRWLEQFRHKTNDDLEVLTTVDMAALDLRRAGKPVSLESVKQVIRNHPEWEAKLNRSCFSDDYIKIATVESGRLFG